MITLQQRDAAREKMVEMFHRAGIVLTKDEINNLEIADFGLNRLIEFGLEVVTYINTKRVCSKDMALFPTQTCPEHRHPGFEGNCEGKEETFRCRYGTVYLYVEGKETPNRIAKIPNDKRDCFTIFHEIVLHAGDQHTILPNIRHWFQAGKEGAIVSEFSTMSCDEQDIFTDSKIDRTPKVVA